MTLNKPRLRLRLSYSLLSAWAKGDVERAVDTYYRLDRFVSPQMEEGSTIHKSISDEIIKTGKIPSYIYSGETGVLESEQSIVVEYNDNLDLKVILDALDIDNHILFEFKTGVQSSMEWARTFQIPLYFLACELADIRIDFAILIHYNQYREQRDVAIIHNTDTIRVRAREYIEVYGQEIYDYFQKEGILYSKDLPIQARQRII